MSYILPAEAWKERGDEREVTMDRWDIHGSPPDTPSYPTRYSGIGLIGQTMGNGGLRWHRGFPWTAPHDTVG